MSIPIDLDNIVNGKNEDHNFTSELLRLIFRADFRNLEKLRLVFPNAVKAVEGWQHNGVIFCVDED